jgi:PQQ-like domain
MARPGRSLACPIRTIDRTIISVGLHVPQLRNAGEAATGTQLWAAVYDGPAHGFDAAEAVVVSPDDGTVYVTGSSGGGTPSSPGAGPDSYVNNLDWATIAYDAATGPQKWVARLDGPVHGNEIATSMVLSADGNSLYVIGATTGNKYLDYLTVDYEVGTPLISVVSRKTHGTAGNFDIDLPLVGNAGY